MHQYASTLILLVSFLALRTLDGFGVTTTMIRSPSFVLLRNTASALYMSSYSTEGSDYASKESEYDVDDDEVQSFGPGFMEDEVDEYDAIELKPVPMSKNSGNRFVAIWFDRLLDTEGRDLVQLHEDRIQYTEDHVMFCRKANLYNETFNTDSMVDVMWSRQILSSDLQRVIGQAMCLESTDISYVKEFMQKEPLMNYLTGGNPSKISLYRWRHLRDYTLRQDDGRFGTPCMMLSFDDDPEEVEGLREETNIEHIEYLIRSERVIAAGPLHVATPDKNDPASVAVGDLIMFNAKDREEAIAFAENDPFAREGLYKTMQAHFYNNLDVTGKFCAWDMLDDDNPCRDMKEAMEIWGYPVDDDQTPWLNW